MEVILLKSSSCHYCRYFLPVFIKSKKKIKKYNFYEYDISSENDAIKKHLPDLDLDNLEGVPTVYIKKDKRVMTVETEFPYGEGDEKALLKNAVTRFKKNLKTGYKNITAENYETFTGGENYEYKVKKYIHKLKEKGIELNEPDIPLYDKYVFYKKNYVSYLQK